MWAICISRIGVGTKIIAFPNPNYIATVAAATHNKQVSGRAVIGQMRAPLKGIGNVA
jgi:hypothetical protein